MLDFLNDVCNIAKWPCVQNRKELEDSVVARDKTLGKYFHQTFISLCCAVLNLSHVWHFATPWTVARQPPLSMGVSRPEPWTGSPCPPPGDLPKGSNPGLPHFRRILYHLRHQGSPRVLEWVAYPFSRKSSQPRNQTGVSCITGGFFTSWATREACSSY